MAASPSPSRDLLAARQAFERDDLETALRLAQVAAARGESAALPLIVNAGIRLRRPDPAIAALRRIRASAPPSASSDHRLAALHNLRGGQRRGHDESAALVDFRAALALQPDLGTASYNLALCLRALGRGDEALAQIEAHLLLHPQDADARLEALAWSAPWPAEANAHHWSHLRDAREVGDAPRLARIAARHGQIEIVTATLERLPEELRAGVALAASDALRERGEVESARDAANIACAASHDGLRSPGLRALFAAHLSLPPIMRSAEAIASDRARLAQALQQLDERWTPSWLARREATLEQLAWSNFHLAYHGENDRALQRAYAALLERAAASFFPALAAPAPRGAGRRVGLLSSCWRDCTAGAYFGGWIGWLRDAGFDVRLYQLGPQRDAVTERLAARASEFVFHDGSLLELAERVRGDRLDLLLYPEIGMDARLLPLAALRLAARQAVAWGHPVTTGLSTFDAYFSCASMETSDAACHYVEPLLTLPGLGVDYARPAAPPPRSRAALGLPETGALVLIPQSLFKLHPDNDAVHARLAALVRDARLVLFDGENALWRRQWLARVRPVFAAHGVDVDAHVHWVPLGSRQRFLQINRACDLMLDSLRWSGGNTSLDAIESGLPLLTCPGESMRSRQSLAMLRALQLDASQSFADAGALADGAAALLREPDRRAAAAARTAQRRDSLFDAEAARHAWLQHVETLCTLS
jgi:predicted O-linked N-acetylglucosamine transferase (SPINDLY family)